MDIQHLDGKVQGQDVVGVVYDAQTVVLGVQGYVECPGEVGVKLVSGIQLTRGNK